MKKLISLLCVFAIILGVYAVPAKQTALQSATKAQAMKIQVPADKAPMGQTIAPLPAKKAAPARKVAAQQAPSVKPQAQQAAAKKATAPQRAKKADSTEDLYAIDFTQDQGEWTIDVKSNPDALETIWVQDSKYGMKASAYNGQNHESEAWLISPAIDLSAVEAATIQLSHARRYGDPSHLSVKASVDGEAWFDLELSAWPDGSNWTFVDAEADLAAFVGEVVRIAFVYTSTSSAAATWEIKTVEVSATIHEEPVVVGAPSDADLANYYDPGQLCVCIYVPGDMACNDIIFTGTYNDWSSSIEECATFAPVDGFDGWYVVAVDDDGMPNNPDAYPYESLQGKPILLDADGNFNWDFQVGAATYIRGGVQIVQGAYAGEIDLINYGLDAPNVYSVDAWKKNPCTAIYHNYTITVVSNGCDGFVVPYLVGTMTNWAFTKMTLDVEKTMENQMPTYSISFKAAEGAEYQILSGLMDVNGEIIEEPAWYEYAYIQELDEDGIWARINGGANSVTGTEPEILIDLREDNLRWARCDESPVENVVLAVKLPVENCPEGVDVIGDFDNWSGTAMQKVDEQGYWWIVRLEAKADQFFKFRAEGSWDQELLVYDEENDMWRCIMDNELVFGRLWVDDAYKGEPVKYIELDLSSDYYRWKEAPEQPVVPTGDTIVLNFQEPMVGYQYYENGDWYLVASDGEYEVALDFFNYNSESPAGSYTENNLYAYYSYVAKRVDSIWDSWNIAKAQIEVIESDLRVDVQASLLASDGNVYEVTMFREKAVPTREEELIVENARLDIYSDSWQLRGYNADETRLLSIAAYSSEVAGDYTTGTLATNYCYVGVSTSDSTSIWYVMSDAEIHVDYDAESTVATITGWMNAVSQADGEVVQFIIRATSAAQPTGKQYDAEDADFIVDFAEYEIDENYLADYGVLFINAINETNEFIKLEVWLPDSASKLIPGVYPVSAEGEPQTVTEGTIANGYIYGSFACNLTEEGSISIPLWLLTSGQVIVNEDGSIKVEAVNSYDRAIQCTLAKRYFPPVEITTCAEAAAAAMTVSENNELFNGGQVFTIRGYVTEISGAWSAQYKNISFWMADEKEGGRVIQAYRAACATQEDAPKVGDLIEITGALTRYNSNPEFAQGSTFVIIERDVKRCGDDLIWELEDGVLTIEGTGEMWDYMNETWGYDITSVNLPEGITSIGISAFAYCQGLKSIKLPSTLQIIKEDAFLYTGLESLDIPANVQLIYGYAFGYCYALTSLRAATNNSLSWSTAAFYSTDNIRNLEAPAWYLRILKGSYLENVRITAGGFSQEAATNLHLSHKTLKKIDLSGLADTYLFDEVLRNCYVLNEVILPQGLETIGFGALAECKTLTSIAIPASVTEIGNSAFEDCRSLIDVQFAPNSKLQRIGNWAFYNCHNLPAIQVPQGVTEIGDGAFYGCVYANELVLPASMVAIGDNAFALCSKLEKIIVDALLPPAIMEKTFFEVSRETPVYVPDESIQAYKDHIYWGQLNIINTHQGLEGVGAETKAQKIVRDGQIYILRGDQIYTVQGQVVR